MQLPAPPEPRFSGGARSCSGVPVNWTALVGALLAVFLVLVILLVLGVI